MSSPQAATGRQLYGTDGAGTVVSTTTPVVSHVVTCKGRPLVSWFLVCTLNLAGTWLIEESLDYDIERPTVNPGRWNDVRLSTDPTIPNAPGGGVAYQQVVRLAPGARKAIRVTFTPTGGTGVPEAWVFAEET